MNQDNKIIWKSLLIGYFKKGLVVLGIIIILLLGYWINFALSRIAHSGCV